MINFIGKDGIYLAVKDHFQPDCKKYYDNDCRISTSSASIF